MQITVRPPKAVKPLLQWRAAERLWLRAGERALEIGCGAGIGLAAVARRLDRRRIRGALVRPRALSACLNCRYNSSAAAFGCGAAQSARANTS